MSLKMGIHIIIVTSLAKIASMRSKDSPSPNDGDGSDDDSCMDLYAHVERVRRIAQRREPEKYRSMSFNGRIDDVDTKSAKPPKVLLRRSLTQQSRAMPSSFLEHNTQPNKTALENRSYCPVPAVAGRSSESSVGSRRTVQVRAPCINSSHSATVGPRKTCSKRSDKPSTSNSSLSPMRSEASSPSRRAGQLSRQLASRSVMQPSRVAGSQRSDTPLTSSRSLSSMRSEASSPSRRTHNSEFVPPAPPVRPPSVFNVRFHRQP